MRRRGVVHDAAGTLLRLTGNVRQRGLHLPAEGGWNHVRLGPGVRHRGPVSERVLDCRSLLRVRGDQPERGLPAVHPERVDEQLELQTVHDAVPDLGWGL